MFPESSQTGTYISRYVQEYENLGSNNLSASSILTKNDGDVISEHTQIVPGADESAMSSTSDLSAGKGRVRKKTIISSVESTNLGVESTNLASFGVASGMAKHNKAECLLCYRTKVLNKIVEKTSLNIQEPKDLVTQNGKLREHDPLFYSPESVISDDSANTNLPDKISNTILRNVMKMANPIMFKACRKILMELKQKYPQSFQDVCLYSEICRNMSQCSYRMTVRRFIQEIFLDLNYDAFSNGVEQVLGVAQQRITDMKLLDNLKMLPVSPPSQSSPANITQSIPIPSHKIHSLKSSLLASVYETSVENLMDSPPQITKDEVDAVVKLRTPEKLKTSPSGSTQIKAEVHPHRQSGTVESGSESLEPMRRRRFYTLELDLSCTKNKFPITHRSPTLASGPSATSTLRRPVSLNATKDGQKPLYKSSISTSDHCFEASSRQTISSPISPPLGTLFCEQRLLTSSRSEATLSNKKNDDKKDDSKIEGK